MTNRIRLVQTAVANRLCDLTDNPKGEHRNRRDQQRDIEALLGKAATVAQTEAVARVLEIPERFFDLHPRSIERDNLLRGVLFEWQ